jgi:hypothetical protein
MLGSVAACRWHSGGLLQLIAVARYVTKVVLLMVLARVVGWWTQDSSSSDAALVTARSAAQALGDGRGDSYHLASLYSPDFILEWEK